jgi:hypothetical protein
MNSVWVWQPPSSSSSRGLKNLGGCHPAATCLHPHRHRLNAWDLQLLLLLLLLLVSRVVSTRASAGAHSWCAPGDSISSRARAVRRVRCGRGLEGQRALAAAETLARVVRLGAPRRCFPQRVPLSTLALVQAAGGTAAALRPAASRARHDTNLTTRRALPNARTRRGCQTFQLRLANSQRDPGPVSIHPQPAALHRVQTTVSSCLGRSVVPTVARAHNSGVGARFRPAQRTHRLSMAV